MKAKEWLKANGHISEVTRGRMSLAHHELLKSELAKGTKFSDYPKKDISVPGEGEASVTVIRSVGSSGNVVPDVPDARYPVESTKVYTLDGVLTKATTRAACFHCGCSLAYCTCDLRERTPRAIVSNSSGYVDVRLVLQ